MGYQSFEKLEVWKAAQDFKLEISRLVKTFPDEEKFRLTDQLLRSSRSITAQIAEGHGRQTWNERLRYCVIARGSLSESLNHLLDALDEQYINTEQLNFYRNKLNEVEKLLNGYIGFLRKKAEGS